ncbi:MAG: hypothetical protein PWQ69_1319 [Methanomicrobiaceae archaeon]|nr:hypothetical protein [Methanomicrobiaceae archaeon]
MMPSCCVNSLGGKVLLMDATPEEVNTYIKRHCKEYYEVYPGFVFKGIRMLLKEPMLLGLQIKKGRILLPFTKRCPNLGTILYEIAADEDDLNYICSTLKSARDEEGLPGSTSTPTIEAGERIR